MDEGRGRQEFGVAPEVDPERMLPPGAHPTAGDRVFEAGLNRLAGGMERAARRMSNRGELWDREGGPRGAMGGAAQRMGDALETGADYIRGQDPAAVRAGLEARVRSRPLTAVVGAVVAGFFLGRVFRS